ncbi:MAG: NUDIX hydrolase [Sphingomonadaceae bacterium]
MSDGSNPPVETVWQGKWITAKRRGRWEYVSRARNIRAAVILAIENGHVLLVEQFRVPLGKPCLELPAGLIGDAAGAEKEDPMLAAGRELIEETGWQASTLEDCGEFYSSPGMVSESFTLVRASGLQKIGPGGGVDGENITTWRVPVTDIANFVATRRAEGVGIDVKLLLLLAPYIAGADAARD